MDDIHQSPSVTKAAAQEATALQLGHLLHQTAQETIRETLPPDPARVTALADELAARAARRAQRSRWTTRWILPAGLSLVATLASVGLWGYLQSGEQGEILPLSPRSPRDVVFGVVGPNATRPGHFDREYTATGRFRLSLRFDTGERFDLEPGAAAVVLRSPGPTRQIRLIEGSLRVSIPPNTPQRWTLLASGFRVRVTGTTFTLRYTPGPSPRFEVVLTRGSVLVQGPALPAAGRSVRPDSPLLFRQSNGRWQRITTTDSAAGKQPAPPRSRVGPTPPTRAGTPYPSTESTWTRWYDAGRYKLLLADAKRRGLPNRLATLKSRRLWLLAQAARYGGVPRLALASLGQLRRRFASSRRAREASYIMARIHHDQLHQPGPACGLFARYLKESPTGVLREEAQGRRIGACRAAGRHTEARKAARAYLRRYPRGIFRDLARRTVPSLKSR